MIKCCEWKTTGQIVRGACNPVSPNCRPGYFITHEELEQLQREAIYYAWDAHKHLRNPELEVSNEEIFQGYLERSKGARDD